MENQSFIGSMMAYSLMCPWMVAVNIWLGKRGFYRTSASRLCLELLKAPVIKQQLKLNYISDLGQSAWTF